jgi:hypothetical protein
MSVKVQDKGKIAVILLALLVLGGMLLLATGQAVAGKPGVFQPTHYANFSGDFSNLHGVTEVQREKNYVHPDIHTNNHVFELSGGNFGPDYDGTFSGYFSLSSTYRDPRFHAGWINDGLYFQLDGYGIYTYDRRTDTIFFETTGEYVLLVKDAVTHEVVAEVTGTPSFTFVGVPLP